MYATKKASEICCNPWMLRCNPFSHSGKLRTSLENLLELMAEFFTFSQIASLSPSFLLFSLLFVYHSLLLRDAIIHIEIIYGITQSNEIVNGTAKLYEKLLKF